MAFVVVNAEKRSAVNTVQIDVFVDVGVRLFGHDVIL